MFNQNGLLQHVMQAWVRGAERKDKQAQTMFLGDQTKDHFFVFLPCFSSFFISTHFFWVIFNSFFLYIFWVLFSAFSLCFCLLIFLEGVRLTTFGSPFFLTFAFRHRAFDRLQLEMRFLFAFIPSVKGDPWSGYIRKFIRLKRGDYG